MQDIRIGVIGAGTMGLRMLDALQRQEGYTVAGVFDPDPRAHARVHALAPEVPLLAGADQLIFRSGLDAVYIASPPASHLEHLRMAEDARLAVLCEKPLAASLDHLASIRRLGLRQCAVNFPFACAPAVQQMLGLSRSGALGEYVGARVRLRFAHWPRAWQAGGGNWLSQPGQGGFTREVLSHFLFLAQRLLGPLQVHSRQLTREPGCSETALRARLRHGAGWFDVDAAVAGTIEDSNRFEWEGTRGSAVLVDWYRLEATGIAPVGAADPTPCTLQAFRRAFHGEHASGLATVQEASQVVELVEALLA